MRTSVELPEELLRRVEAEAELRGRKFDDLVEEGLRLLLERARHGKRVQPGLSELMAPARGVVHSGVADLASNPEHLRGFGRRPRRSR